MKCYFICGVERKAKNPHYFLNISMFIKILMSKSYVFIYLCVFGIQILRKEYKRTTIQILHYT